MNQHQTITLSDTIAWLINAGLKGRSERGLTEGLGERLQAHGVPVDRISTGSEVLDPVLQSRSFTWHAHKETETFRHQHGIRETDDWKKSFLSWMIKTETFTCKIRLGTSEADAFTTLKQLHDEGNKEYYARMIQFGDRARLGIGRGLFATFATRAEAGFSPEHIATIEAILPAFTLAFMAQAKTRMVSRVLATYLGDRPAQSVLNGQITRGETQTITAVIWMSDIAGYTEVADQMRREGILEFLNVYAEIVADAIYAHGGEVLKFIGDGVLAVFERNARNSSPAEAALRAALAVRSAVARTQLEREANGKVSAEIVIGLHHGTVLFGNFGSASRLDFTALGSAVNEASRLISLAKTLEQTIITSSEFRGELAVHQDELVSLGRYVLRSVSGARHLYTVDPELELVAS